MNHSPSSIPSFTDRIQTLSDYPMASGSRVVYWMQSAQRLEDNMALNYAADIAHRQNLDLSVVFCLDTPYPGANIRHFWFMVQGLTELSKRAQDYNLDFCVFAGKPEEVVDGIDDLALLVCENAYLRHLREWRTGVARKLYQRKIPLRLIDSEVIVPHHLVSWKLEYSAATIRKKITRQWLPYLHGAVAEREFFMGSPGNWLKGSNIRLLEIRSAIRIRDTELSSLAQTEDFNSLIRIKNLLPVDTGPPPSESFAGGEKNAHDGFDSFLDDRFPTYGKDRNDPTDPKQSNLSPYLHFGMISPLRAAWKAVEAAIELREIPKLSPQAVPSGSLEAFLEEMVVRRELAKNFCLHNPNYDSYAGIPQWALESLTAHRKDIRPVLYHRNQLENAENHDRYWNACQREMLVKGKMQGYMRMYWGKKVIEWTRSPEEAFEHLLYLNDRYELDGRDENGYAGISWCFGTHDRGWKERPIFGKIRYMNAKGLERKFKIQEYARNWLPD